MNTKLKQEGVTEPQAGWCSKDLKLAYKEIINSRFA